jgi:hypothetical protein
LIKAKRRPFQNPNPNTARIPNSPEHDDGDSDVTSCDSADLGSSNDELEDNCKDSWSDDVSESDDPTPIALNHNGITDFEMLGVGNVWCVSTASPEKHS